MGTDKQQSPLTPEALKKQQANQHQAQEPSHTQEKDPERRQAGDKPAIEQISAGKPNQHS